MADIRAGGLVIGKFSVLSPATLATRFAYSVALGTLELGTDFDQVTAARRATRARGLVIAVVFILHAGYPRDRNPPDYAIPLLELTREGLRSASCRRFRLLVRLMPTRLLRQPLGKRPASIFIPVRRNAEIKVPTFTFQLCLWSMPQSFRKLTVSWSRLHSGFEQQAYSFDGDGAAVIFFVM